MNDSKIRIALQMLAVFGIRPADGELSGKSYNLHAQNIQLSADYVRRTISEYGRWLSGFPVVQ
jgi:hypothetical protein